jgi:tRNA pseudouridine38-40 synthase
MPTYKLILAYDGTAYAGWQQQPGLPSVLGTLEKTFQHTFNVDARLLGASRTDAGVHALGQVVRCVTPLVMCADKLAWILNNSLPADIHIRQAELVADDFHPHYNVAYKTYYYHMFTERPLPFVARYGWYYYRALDIQKLDAALQLFVGTHDFSRFCAAEDMRPDKVRTIDAISLQYLKRFRVYRIQITGHRFVRHMIRRMVGAAVQIASDPTSRVDSIMQVLAGQNPPMVFLNAPAQGLLLYNIVYTQG